MKVRALANLSGPFGNKEVGDEFVITAAQFEDIKSTGWVEEVAEPKTTNKADKAADAADAKA